MISIEEREGCCVHFCSKSLPHTVESVISVDLESRCGVLMWSFCCSETAIDILASWIPLFHSSKRSEK